jgi:hypothetical protein
MSDLVQFSDLLEIEKRQAKVLILGSYRDPRLEMLKVSLISKGFEGTRLVKDWVDEEKAPKENLDEHFRGKSFYYIDNWAEIFVFVFFKDADNISVTREWSHMIESSKEKCGKSVILSHEDLDLGALVRGDIGSERIRNPTFKDDNELCESAFSGCFSVLYSLIGSKPIEVEK